MDIAAAIQRRNAVMSLGQYDYSGVLYDDVEIAASLLQYRSNPPNLRSALESMLTFRQYFMPAPGSWFSPEYAYWITGPGGNQLVSGTPGTGQTNIFQSINGTSTWTDPNLNGQWVKAVHFNEMREFIEKTIYGRWQFPIMWIVGIASFWEDPWYGGGIAHDVDPEESVDDLGYCSIRKERDGIIEGLHDVTILSASIKMYVDTACTVELGLCNQALLFEDPYQGWSSVTEFTSMGSCSSEPGSPGTISGAAAVAGIQAIIDGAYPNFRAKRVDNGIEWIGLMSDVTVEFQLTIPPN
jgi:hypothetical protein